MSAVVQENQMVETFQEIQSAALPRPAIDSKPLAGGEFTLKFALTPGMITMIAAPVTVLVTMVMGWVLLRSMGQAIFAREMTAAAIVNTAGGMLSALPLFLLMKRGIQSIARAGLMGIALRVGAIMMGLVLTIGPGWGLARMPLVYWVLGLYFPMLMVETATVAWLSHKARH
jgi:hypothetical protein